MAEPMNPLAGKAGPGKFSVREDLPPSTEYGERKQMQEIIGEAPTATTRGSADPQLGRPASANFEDAAPRTALQGLFDPVEDKDVDIMRGSRLGPQGGPELLQMQKQQSKTSDALVKLLPFDTTGEIAILYQQALAIGD
jgi:hypothetical protein